MADPIHIELLPDKALRSLSETLGQYKQVSGLTNRVILIKQGRKLSIELYKAFRRDKPREDAVFRDLKKRGFSFGRRQRTSSTGISERARDRASQRMGGFKSILAQVDMDAGGKILLRGVRIGKRGTRLALRTKLSRGSTAVAGNSLQRFGQSISSKEALDKRPGDVVLNRRAVETIEESNLRRAGRGFLAASWLYRRWIAVNVAGAGKEEVLLAQNPRSSLALGLLGNVRLRDDDDDQSLALTSHVPGIESIGYTRGRFGRAILNLRDDIRTYVKRKQTEALVASIRGGRNAGLRAALSP